MAEKTSGTPDGAVPAASQTPATGPKPPAGPTIHIGEEFGTAKRNLPPAKIVGLAVAGVAVIAGIAIFLMSGKTQGSGTLDNVAAVEIPGQSSTMVALTFTLKNTTDKILYVRSIAGQLKTAGADSQADAVSAVDFDRYFQAFPALKVGAQPALPPETKIQPGETVARTVIVAFPVKLDAFNQRQSLSVVIWPYDQSLPIVLTK
ncbi:MAG TPA: hypothetical protein VEH49_07825 [Methylomirabilota bacterium]|nr:hypothetical protein [Methylomirabilota bacterium]